MRAMKIYGKSYCSPLETARRIGDRMAKVRRLVKAGDLEKVTFQSEVHGAKSWISADSIDFYLERN